MSNQAFSKPSDRRRSPRIELLGRVQGHLVSLDIPVTVLDLSLGGTLIRTRLQIAIGEIHEFSLMLGDESAVVLRGRAVRSRQVDEAEGPSYETGFQFLDDDAAEGDSEVAGLIDHLH